MSDAKDAGNVETSLSGRIVSRDVVTRIEDVTPEALALLTWWVGPTFYDVSLQRSVFDEDERFPALPRFHNQTIELDPRLKGHAALMALFEGLAKAFEWHFGKPSSDRDRWRVMATFAMQMLSNTTIDSDHCFFLPIQSDEKSGSPQKPATVQPESKDSGKARPVAAA